MQYGTEETYLQYERFHTVRPHIVKHPFNHTNQMHNLYYLHTFYCVSPSCFRVTLTIIRENLCALYLKTHSVRQLLSVATGIVAQ